MSTVGAIGGSIVGVVDAGVAVDGVGAVVVCARIDRKVIAFGGV